MHIDPVVRERAALYQEIDADMLAIAQRPRCGANRFRRFGPGHLDQIGERRANEEISSLNVIISGGAFNGCRNDSIAFAPQPGDRGPGLHLALLPFDPRRHHFVDLAGSKTRIDELVDQGLDPFAPCA